MDIALNSPIVGILLAQFMVLLAGAGYLRRVVKDHDRQLREHKIELREHDGKIRRIELREAQRART